MPTLITSNLKFQEVSEKMAQNSRNRRKAELEKLENQVYTITAWQLDYFAYILMGLVEGYLSDKGIGGYQCSLYSKNY